MSRRASAAVVVCTATKERTALLRACVDSVLGGTRVPDEILVVVDQNPSLRRQLARCMPESVHMLETDRRGLSEARNAGLWAAASDVIAFVDDDAVADADWLDSLIDAFEADDDLLGAGGSVAPRWGADRRWMPDELLWVVGCTYRGHREDAGPIRNPIGCNMAFRRRALIAAGGFAAGFGRRGNALNTCDETELALRLERAHGAHRIRYVPQAGVRHFVPAARISWRLLLRRSASEGLVKGRLGRLYGRRAVANEYSYVRWLLADAVPGLLVAGIRQRDAEPLLGAAAILVSLAVTGAAFVLGSTGVPGAHLSVTRRAR